MTLLAGGRLALQGLRDHHGLPRVRPPTAQEAGLVERPHGRGEEGGRGQELEDRPLGRHPARRASRTTAAHPSATARRARIVWNFPDAMPMHREPLYTRGPTWSRSTRPRRQEALLAPADPLQVDPGQGLTDKAREVPADPHLRPPGRVRRRRRGNPLEPVARRAAAGDVRRRSTRRTPTTAASRTATGSGSKRPKGAPHQGRGDGHASASATGVVFMPFPLRAAGTRARTCSTSTRRAPRPRARRGCEHRLHLRLRLGDDDAGNARPPSARSSAPGRRKGDTDHGQNEIHL